MPRSSHGLNALLLLAVVLCALSVVDFTAQGAQIIHRAAAGKRADATDGSGVGAVAAGAKHRATPRRVGELAEQKMQMQLPAKGQTIFIRVAPNGK